MKGKPRIFWMGAHKVLKTTELVQLREMGYEVFNPAYITPIYDQSMDRRIDNDQASTLPADVFNDLIRYNFFYNKIEDRVAEILNDYFDCLIVTINADWLKEFLIVFHGPIIYRTYGQHFLLSDKFIEIDIWRLATERSNFTVVPFCDESIEHEHRWFRELCTHVVPYQIPDDVFARTGSWGRDGLRREMATGIPNIQNPYFDEAYRVFNAAFPHRLFRIYGPQRATPRDSRIVGSLSRETLLDHFSRSSGFLYNFDDAVCYLPPVEMMEIGGPVIYRPGSLLSRMYGQETPGLILDQYDAEQKIKRLLDQDAGFVTEVVAAQECVRRRYDRSMVRPAFEAAFTEILETPLRADRFGLPSVKTTDRERQKLIILLHVDGLFRRSKGRTYATEGIPRVVDIIVHALSLHSSILVEATCTPTAEPILYDFFDSAIRQGKVRLRRVDKDHEDKVDIHRDRLRLVQSINNDRSILAVLIPHYYLFPEALLISKTTILYLPDYFPYLMPGAVFDVSVEKDAENKRVGVALASKAKAILTNSEFTAAYLPKAGFVTEGDDKVRVAPLPLLGAARASSLADQETATLTAKLCGRPFIFYPTANRPNKQLAFLLKVIALLRMRRPDILLVLTTDLGFVPAVEEAYHRYDLEGHVLLLPACDESTLRWLYENSLALCLTSTLEGNFPPQVLEALAYQTPVVATRLTPIVDALGEQADDLLLCRPLDLDDFAAKLELAIIDRGSVLNRQLDILRILERRTSLESFFAVLSSMITSQTSDDDTVSTFEETV